LLLHELCRWFGGEHRLAHYLGVDVQTVVEWLEGARPVPDRVFLACLDVLRPGAAD
jgi:DNA-binding transcriptional regulator YiaG